MSDRTTARLFAVVFEGLAAIPQSKERDSLAEEMWQSTGEYDFCTYQMYCDDHLVTLGLAKHGDNPDYPEEILYRGEDYEP